VAPDTDPTPTVLVLMGVSGAGKSTVAALLAARLGWDVEEGDDLHPAANVAKMAAGHPLDDADRAPWLVKVAAWIDAHLAAGRPGIITCSALERSYRDVLRRDGVVFVHLAGTREQIARRLDARRGHFMPAGLLDSQFAALEPPGPDEAALTVDISAGSTELADEIIRRLHLGPAGTLA
jgi:carbohydrate kinase (thermoresistant glucokinase family)